MHLPLLKIRRAAIALVAVGLALPASAAKRVESEETLPPWAEKPDRVKLEIAERLVFEKKQYRASLAVIADMRREGVDTPILDLLQGVAMREQGLFEESERLLLMARKKMPGDVRVHEALCVLYADTQDLDKAIGSCEKATKVDDERASSWNNLGYLYLITDRQGEALEAFRLAVDIDGSEQRYRNNLGLAHVALGDTSTALATFRTTGSEADALYNVGAAVERWNGTAAAEEWYRRALKVDADHAASRRALEVRDESEAAPEAPGSEETNR